jgi:hypothetical protein
MYSPQDLVIEAIKKLEEKALQWLDIVNKDNIEES